MPKVELQVSINYLSSFTSKQRCPHKKNHDDEGEVTSSTLSVDAPAPSAVGTGKREQTRRKKHGNMWPMSHMRSEYKPLKMNFCRVDPIPFD